MLHALKGIGTMATESSSFVVMRIDRRGELAPTYLRGFALSGRNGLRQLGFGPEAAAYRFERQVEAEDIARRLRRRISAEEYDYVVAEAADAMQVPS
jgi:hypothetical protein